MIRASRHLEALLFSIEGEQKNSNTYSCLDDEYKHLPSGPCAVAFFKHPSYSRSHHY